MTDIGVLCGREFLLLTIVFTIATLGPVNGRSRSHEAVRSCSTHQTAREDTAKQRLPTTGEMIDGAWFPMGANSSTGLSKRPTCRNASASQALNSC